MVDFLKKQQLTNNQISELLANAQILNVKKHTILLKEKEKANRIYFVESGILRSGIHKDESKNCTYCFYSPEGLRWAGLSANSLLRKPSDYFIEVLEDAQIISFDLIYFQKLRHTNLEWANFFQCQLLTVYSYLEQKSVNQLKLSPEERYLAFIETNPTIIKNIPLHYIASYIGVVPESLSRIRRRLN